MQLGALLLAGHQRDTRRLPLAGHDVETVKMPFSVQGDEALTEKIAVRLTADEKAKLRQDADLAGLSISELVRRRYFGRPIRAKVDLAVANQLRHHMGQLKKFHGDTQGRFASTTADILSDIHAELRRLRLDHQED